MGQTYSALRVPLTIQEAKEEQKGPPPANASAKKEAKPSKAATTSPTKVDDEPGKYPSKESIGPFCESQIPWPA